MERGSFWDTISSQLQNKGPDYVARCNCREKPLNAGDYVIRPASFSHSPVRELQEMTPLIKASEEELEEVWKLCSESLSMVYSRFECTGSLYACVCPFKAPRGTLAYTFYSLEKHVLLSQVMHFGMISYHH